MKSHVTSTFQCHTKDSTVTSVNTIMESLGQERSSNSQISTMQLMKNAVKVLRKSIFTTKINMTTKAITRLGPDIMRFPLSNKSCNIQALSMEGNQ